MKQFLKSFFTIILMFIITIYIIENLNLKRELRITRDANAALYNQGYRAGRLESLSELVECQNVKDARVLDLYNKQSQLLQNLGELDDSPYSCQE